MQIPNPIVFAATAEDGLVFAVYPARGGLEGYELLGQGGPPFLAEISTDSGLNWTEVNYPMTLSGFLLLRISRTDESPDLSMILAMAPLEESGGLLPFSMEQDDGGYILIRNADWQEDYENPGYQFILGATTTYDEGGYAFVQRGTP